MNHFNDDFIITISKLIDNPPTYLDNPEATNLAKKIMIDLQNLLTFMNSKDEEIRAINKRVVFTHNPEANDLVDTITNDINKLESMIPVEENVK